MRTKHSKASLNWSSSRLAKDQCKRKALRSLRKPTSQGMAVPSLRDIQTCLCSSVRFQVTLECSALYWSNHCLLLLVSVSGYVSYRERTQGSWFIQSLCRCISLHKSEHDLCAIAAKVSRMVGYERQGRKQIPFLYSTLTRPIKLADE